MHFRVVVEGEIRDGEKGKEELLYGSGMGNDTNCYQILTKIAQYDVVDIPLVDNISQQTPSPQQSPPSTSHTPYLHLHSSPLSALCHKEDVKYHTDYSRHWEDLLGDRYLRAIAGLVPEGDDDPSEPSWWWWLVKLITSWELRILHMDRQAKRKVYLTNTDTLLKFLWLPHFPFKNIVICVSK